MEMPPPTLKVSDVDAAQYDTTEELENTLDDKMTEAPGANRDTAPPLALLEPGWQVADHVDETLSLKVECAKTTVDDVKIATAALVACLGYT
jgi:hypothetical protein